jgi:hypothetical protein
MENKSDKNVDGVLNSNILLRLRTSAPHVRIIL